jgi:translation initiation factor 1
MSRLVYSTDVGAICPDCGEPKHSGKCSFVDAIPEGDGIVRIRRETAGRKGKGVSLVEGLLVDSAELNRIAKMLKQKCSCGGKAKDGVIEIQGDQREKMKALLEGLGHTVKLAGG